MKKLTSQIMQKFNVVTRARACRNQNMLRAQMPEFEGMINLTEGENGEWKSIVIEFSIEYKDHAYLSATLDWLAESSCISQSIIVDEIKRIIAGEPQNDTELDGRTLRIIPTPPTVCVRVDR